MDTELENFKQRINLVEFAESFGYSIIKKESSRSSTVMKAGADKIIVATDQADGHGIYFSVGDDSDGGSVIDFAQKRMGGAATLGHVRKELRMWMPSPKRPSPKRKPEDERPQRPEPITRDRAQLLARAARLVPYAGSYLTDVRGVQADVLEAFRVLQDERGNACFLHYDGSGVCGWETKNRDFTGYSSGGMKALTMACPDADAPTRIVICESAIDSMSWMQLMGHQRGTVYASTGGALSPGQLEQLHGLFDRYPSAQVVLAHDADAGGDALASQIAQIVPHGTNVVRDRPTEGKDWNDALRASLKPKPARGMRLR